MSFDIPRAFGGSFQASGTRTHVMELQKKTVMASKNIWLHKSTHLSGYREIREQQASNGWSEVSGLKKAAKNKYQCK